MELRVSSLKRLGLSTSDCASDPEEKEVSDEDDDDRNHKHRRKESQSQSMQRDLLETVSNRPFRKRNRLFDNGHPFRENESQDYTTKFEKRRPGPGSFPQRVRPNQLFSGDPGSIRGRGRDPLPWGQHDPRFNQADLASGLFAGRGLPNISNPQSGSWNGFGLIPGIPNGGLDTLHTIGLQGTLAPAVNSSLNMRITRQRCRDFEERGFCLRGDMCPMEHGVNRIVVEDVQSLSQFNLPVSLPSAQLVGPPSVPGGLQGIGNPSTMSANSKALTGNSTKSGLYDDNPGLNGGYSGSVSASGADFYDPDQPLWNNSGPETSNSLLHLHSPKNNGTDSLMNVDPSDQDHAGLVTGSSVWGRISGIRNRREGKEKMDSTPSNVGHLENGANKEEQDASANPRGAFRRGKQHVVTSEDIGGPASDNKPLGGQPMRVMRKPSQKALRTLFVAGIPLKSNRRETLLSHFHKFGEIIDIYIPSKSDRAFIQFSKKEEAEAALMAPDAVMGNRFIKLWWANRDSIPDGGVSSSNSGVSLPPRGTGSIPVPPHPSVGNKGKDIVQSSGAKVASDIPSDASTEYQKLPNANSPIGPPPVPKKLEQLKEELRKKQEMLDQKRNDFRRQLEKLQKQTTVTKSEVSTETPKKSKVAADAAKTTTETMLSVPSPSPCREMKMANKNKSTETASPTSKIIAGGTVPEESSDSKWLPPVRPVVPIVGSPCLANRYKLDNRPTTFKIIPPLPAGLANVDVLKEHFSTFGNLTSVELESAEPCQSDGGDDDDDDTSKTTATKLCSCAHATFATRRSAETAFVNGKTWQGHDLRFTWMASSSTSTNNPRSKATTPLPLPDDKSKKPDPQEAQHSETNGGVEKSELSEPPQPHPTEDESVQIKPALTKISTEKEASSGKEEPVECEDGC
ncbi:unnamed protein product [Linum trigynum]|uniref:Zinc finger CCCH domain-containing protein 41 n=1 Tax=Linum trigynum TaxID=586398 RepID=A0AAV2CQH5_9ROSI